MPEVLSRPIMPFASSVHNQENEEIGYIAASYNVEKIVEKIEGFNAQTREFGIDGYAFMLNEDGEYIAHPQENKVLQENILKRLRLIKNY